MISGIIANIGTIIIGLILLTVVALIIAKIVRDKKKGKSVGCGCGCADCPSATDCGK
ncbi:MAG: FeoB-associated Cys-rich membrane protein [Lachnospiraceae bacterium]|jgi:hypothetical protein|nr:FeoB-associated Cys-rich membrane protein [Lachnospiraceae bacterium]